MKKHDTEDRLDTGISRRSFLKGTAIGTAGLAAATMLSGCSTKDEIMTAEKAAEGKWSFEIPPDPIPDSKIKETISADIIVIGAGMAGLATACSAIEKGADVMVVSASSKPISRGGSNHGIGSEYQKSKGVDYTPERAREIVKTEQTAGTYFMDKQKWERWINNSAESMDWMIDKMAAKGLRVSLEPGYYDPDGVLTVPHASHNFWNEEQPFGALFGAPMQAQAYADHITDMGGAIHYKTVAKYLIREDNNTGRVSGFVAQNEAGEYLKYEAAKAVVLATGDFSRNKDMMAKYSPWAYDIFKEDLSEEVDYDAGLMYTGLLPGDGHKMGLWAGAAWQKTFPNAPMINGGVPGPSHAVISNFWGINLDINGKRYMNECTNFAYGAMAVLQLPKRTAFGIWDVNYAYTQEAWEPFGHCLDEENGIKSYTPEEYIAQWDEQYEKADTIDALLDKLGFSGEAKQNALTSVENYNRYAQQGYDEEFQVNPEILYPISQGPFYGSKTTGATFLTVCGGLRTDAHLQVCDAEDTPIEGLYNTGIMLGDFYANSYNFVMPGQNLGGVCCTLSYLLGRELAQL